MIPTWGDPEDEDDIRRTYVILLRRIPWMTYRRLSRLTDRQIDDLARLNDDNEMNAPPEPEPAADEPLKPASEKTPQERYDDWTATCALFGIQPQQAAEKFVRTYGKTPQEMGVKVIDAGKGK